MEIKVYATLRDIVGGPTVQLNDVSELTVEEMLQKMFAQYPKLEPEFYKSNGDVHPATRVLVNGRDVQYMNGWDTIVTAEDTVRIFPPVGGGR